MARRLAVAIVALVLAATSACVLRTETERSDRPGDDAAVTTEDRPSPGDGAGGPVEQDMAREIFVRVNDERQRRGMPALQWNHELTRLARAWSEHLASIGRLEHRDINDLLGSEGLEEYKALGENIFRATAPVPAGEIHVGWMRSDGHRRNVLQPGFDQIGIGVVCTPEGAVYATQEFGRLFDSDHPPMEDDLPPRQPIERAAETGPSCAG